MAAGRKTGGRKAGTPNKVTADLKDMILQALNEAHEDGGVAYLKEQAIKTPTAFISLVGKVLPLQLAGDPDNPLVVHRIELIAPKMAGMSRFDLVAPQQPSVQ